MAKRISPLRYLLFFLFLTASFVWGLWVGEDPYLTHIKVFGLLLAVQVVFSILAVRRVSKLRAALSAVLVLAVTVTGFMAGDYISTRAFNSCVVRGDEVRNALDAYFLAHSRYPNSLNSLDLPDLPGNRLLRGNVLFYETSGDDYVLSFSDWLVEHTATRDGWTVRK